MELPFFFVPQSDGKLPSESLPRSLLMIFPEMRNNFGIAMSPEAMSFPNEFLPTFDVIKQFAVKDHAKAAVLVRHRLLPVGQVDDAQPARSEGNPRLLKKTFLIRAT